MDILCLCGHLLDLEAVVFGEELVCPNCGQSFIIVEEQERAEDRPMSRLEQRLAEEPREEPRTKPRKPSEEHVIELPVDRPVEKVVLGRNTAPLGGTLKKGSRTVLGGANAQAASEALKAKAREEKQQKQEPREESPVRDIDGEKLRAVEEVKAAQEAERAQEPEIVEKAPERRIYPRFPAKGIQVSLGYFGEYSVIDICLGGLGFDHWESDWDFYNGRPLFLDILDQGKIITKGLRAKVVRGDHSFAGCQFQNLNGDQKKMLERLVKRQALRHSLPSDEAADGLEFTSRGREVEISGGKKINVIVRGDY